MDLYLLRHGQAGSRAEWEGPDSERPLTGPGRKGMAGIASSFAKMGLHIDAIVTSPYVRCRQTADILAEHLHLQDKVSVDERLAPGFRTRSLSKVLGQISEPEAVVLVGHEPDMSSLIADLTGGAVVMKKGGMAYIRAKDLTFKGAELVWLAQPGMMGR